MFNKTALVSIVFVALSLTATEARADCDGVHCTDVTVDRLHVHMSGISIRTSGDEDHLDCDSGSSDYIILYLSHPNYEQIARILEDSHRNATRIWVRVKTVPLDEPCEIDYVVSDR